MRYVHQIYKPYFNAGNVVEEKLIQYNGLEVLVIQKQLDHGRKYVLVIGYHIKSLGKDHEGRKVSEISPISNNDKNKLETPIRDAGLIGRINFL